MDSYRFDSRFSDTSIDEDSVIADTNVHANLGAILALAHKMGTKRRPAEKSESSSDSEGSVRSSRSRSSLSPQRRWSPKSTSLSRIGPPPEHHNSQLRDSPNRRPRRRKRAPIVTEHNAIRANMERVWHEQKKVEELNSRPIVGKTPPPLTRRRPSTAPHANSPLKRKEKTEFENWERSLYVHEERSRDDYKPKLCENSMLLDKSVGERDNLVGDYRYEAMYRQARERERVQNRLRAKARREEEAQCSFKPHINKRSREIASTQKRSFTARQRQWEEERELALAQLQQQAREKEKEESAEVSFKPRINHLDEAVITSTSATQVPGVDKFVERLEKARLEKEAAKAKMAGKRVDVHAGEGVNGRPKTSPPRAAASATPTNSPPNNKNNNNNNTTNSNNNNNNTPTNVHGVNGRGRGRGGSVGDSGRKKRQPKSLQRPCSFQVGLINKPVKVEKDWSPPAKHTRGPAPTHAWTDSERAEVAWLDFDTMDPDALGFLEMVAIDMQRLWRGHRDRQKVVHRRQNGVVVRESGRAVNAPQHTPRGHVTRSGSSMSVSAAWSPR